MRTRFEIPFVCEDVRFSMPVHAKVTLHDRRPESGPPIDAPVEIEPNWGSQPKSQDGVLRITLPGEPKGRAETAKWILALLEQHIAFFYAAFRLNGMLSGKRIPETDEEREQIGDRPYWVDVINLVEVGEPEVFDKECLRSFPPSEDTMRSLTQFVAAGRARSKIDQFLGYFKVIEVLYYSYSGERGKRASDYLQSEELVDVIRSTLRKRDKDGTQRALTDEEVEKLVTNLVDIRDRCAHLQQTGYGFAPYDEGVSQRVEPNTKIVQELAREAILRVLNHPPPTP
jgi:hypothetical protein